MRDLSRRDAVMQAAGLVLGAGVIASHGAAAEETKTTGDALELCAQDLSALMFIERVTSKIGDHGDGRDLVITSALSAGRRTSISVRSRSVRIFRPDPDVDEFTKQGGLYWEFGEIQGKTQLKMPHVMVMVVRDADGTVQWYPLSIDFRC